MRHTLYTIILSMLALTLHAQGPQQPDTPQQEQLPPIDAAWFKANYTKAEYMIPMRDGVRLYTAVFTPKSRGGDHPILMTRTPYGCAPYGRRSASFWEQPIFENYLRADYIIVFQDVRGRWRSEGTFVNVRPLTADKTSGGIDEATDAYDTVEWLLRKVRRHNGRVGVFGNSYSGFYALMAAASGHPAIRAVSPQAPVCDWFLGDDFHHNGAFALSDAVGFLPNFGTAGRTKPSDRPEAFNTPVEGNPVEYLMNNTVADITRALDGQIPFWEEMAAHPDYDEWWQQRSALNATHGIRSAILMVGGLFDAEDLYGTWNIYRALRQNSPEAECRIVMGPWTHGAWRGGDNANTIGHIQFTEESMSKFYRDEVEFPFFDLHLRDAGHGGASSTGALIFFSGENCWREMEGWDPEAENDTLTLHLAENGSMTASPSDISESYSFYTSDPHDPVPYYPDMAWPRRKEYMTAGQEFVDRRHDVLTFLSPRLENDITAAGAIEATIYAAISTSDADFIVKVIDVGPDGEYEMLIRGDIMRGRYRNGFSTPEAFTPGRVERITLTMPDIAHTFLAGHRIKVQIQSTWFPLFDRNPQQMIDTYTCTKEDFVPCEVKIYHDANRPSNITLRIMK